MFWKLIWHGKNGFLWLIITRLFRVFSHLQCSKVSPKRSVKIFYCGENYDRDFENESSDEFYIILIPKEAKMHLPFIMLKKGTFL